MRWRGRRKSSNVEDRRSVRVSSSASTGRGGGVLRLLPVVFKFLGFKGTAILAACVFVFGLFTGNLGNMLGVLGLQQGSPTNTQTRRNHGSPSKTTK